MKIRNGFVSNSSSSSFIVAVAKVADKKKLNAWLKTLKVDKYDYMTLKLKDIIPFDKKEWNSVYKKDDEVIVESFNTSVKLNVKKMKDKDNVFIVSIMNNEGDCGRFSGCDEYGNYQGFIDYDIDIDYFGENQLALWDGLNGNNGLSDVAKTYGAGRNG